MIGIAVITYNRLQSLKLCIASIRKHTRKPYHLLVCDDGSTDGTQEWCRTVHIPLCTGDNVGIAGNKNRALSTLLYGSFDAYVLIEDDTRILKPNWDAIFQFAIPATGNSLFVHTLRRHQADYRETYGTHSVTYFKKSNGFFMIMTPEVLRTVGGFDRRFGQYGFEHYDFSYRVFKAGLTRGINPHLESTSTFITLDSKVKSILSVEAMKTSIQKNQKILAQSIAETDAGDVYRPRDV